MQSQPIAELRDVTKRYGTVTAVTGMNLAIMPGEFLSFLGPSGCGKTTALRMLAGFEQASDGEVMIDGQNANGLPAWHRPVNMVFQQYALFPHLTVAENVAYGLNQRRPKPPKSEVAAAVKQALAMVRLPDFGGRRIWEMSGGQQQRVALARAIVNRPKILLLDEPMAALDKKLRHDMQIELKSLQRELGITFVLVTHDQDEALSMSDRIVIMEQGRIAQIGTPEQLYDQPANRYVADFVGRSNFISAVAGASEGGLLEAEAIGGLKIRARLPVTGSISPRAAITLSLRPEEVRLSTPQVGDAPNGHAMEVTHRIFLGEHTEYHLRSPSIDRLVAVLPRPAGSQEAYAPGSPVLVSWRDGAALALSG